MTKTCKNCGHDKNGHFNNQECMRRFPDCPCEKFEGETYTPERAIRRAWKPQKGSDFNLIELITKKTIELKKMLETIKLLGDKLSK